MAAQINVRMSCNNYEHLGAFPSCDAIRARVPIANGDVVVRLRFNGTFIDIEASIENNILTIPVVGLNINYVYTMQIYSGSDYTLLSDITYSFALLPRTYIGFAPPPTPPTSTDIIIELTVPVFGASVTSPLLLNRRVAAVMRTGGVLLSRDFTKPLASNTLTLNAPNMFGAGEEIVITFLS